MLHQIGRDVNVCSRCWSMQLCNYADRLPRASLEATGLHLALLITSKLEAFTTSSHVTSTTLNSQPRVTYCLTPTFTGPATLPASPRHWLQGVALIEDALQSGGISSRKLSSCSSIKRNLSLWVVLISKGKPEVQKTAASIYLLAASMILGSCWECSSRIGGGREG